MRNRRTHREPSELTEMLDKDFAITAMARVLETSVDSIYEETRVLAKKFAGTEYGKPLAEHRTRIGRQRAIYRRFMGGREEFYIAELAKETIGGFVAGPGKMPLPSSYEAILANNDSTLPGWAYTPGSKNYESLASRIQVFLPEDPAEKIDGLVKLGNYKDVREEISYTIQVILFGTLGKERVAKNTPDYFSKVATLVKNNHSGLAKAFPY